jgi:molybdopterin molybdotransferase
MTRKSCGTSRTLAHGMMPGVNRLLEIRDRLIAAQPRLGIEERPLVEAEGRYLAAPVLARRDSPPSTCSAMDGYAVRSGEVAGPAELGLGPSIFAGGSPAPLRPGEAARIFTGAALPAGADAVVREEAVVLAGDRVRFRAAARPGENVRRAGEDVVAGGEALPAGLRLLARQLALLAAVGVERVALVRRPRLTVLSTGDEVVSGRVPDSNGIAVASLCGALGAEVERGRVADRLGEVEAALAGASARGDAVLTIGGVSVGERDLVPEALRRLGAELLVHGVPMKPGKPFLFARLGGRPVFGLPGSPSACLVAFEVFARPALLTMAGSRAPLRRTLRLRLAEAASGRPGRARLLWARLTAAGDVELVGRDAAQVRGPALANALVVIGAGEGTLPAGAEVTAWLLDDAG